MKRTIIFVVLYCMLAGLQAQHLEIYPSSDVIPHNDDFSVKVRIPGQKWVELYEYEVNIDAHKVQKLSMVHFGFDKAAHLAVTSNKGPVKSVRIRPLSYHIPFTIKGNTVFFEMHQPADVSVEINGDVMHNLHVLTNTIEELQPSENDSNTIVLKAGVHRIDTLRMQSHQRLYLAPGAVLMGKIICDKVKDVHIGGRGIVFRGQRGVEVTHSENVTIKDLVFINPAHYTILGGQSRGIKIEGIRSFSAKGWSDGIDLMSCSDVEINRVFMRNSDDCIALYGHRWNYYGDTRNVKVTNSVLWADVAHPIMIGTHGNSEPGKWETIENIRFENIDILDHDEPQIDYQGCMAINVSDENLARNITFQDIRVDEISRGQLINLRVTYNKKYATAPGRGIENVFFRNVTYTGLTHNLSIIEGYSPERPIKNIVFENLTINGVLMSPRMNKPKFMKISDFANIYEGLYATDIQYTDSASGTAAP